MPPGSVFAGISLLFGAVFFAYAARYYLFTATVFVLQFVSSLRNSNGNSNKNKGGNRTGNLNGLALGLTRDRNSNSNRNSNHEWQSEPLVSIHVATYNERNVINRLIASCMSLDYSNYEVIIVDDSTDETVDILERWRRSQVELNHATDGGQIQQAVLELRKPALKIIHRETRTGFKGGALNEALRHMDPNADYVLVLDADFVPAPDLIKQFLTYVQVADVASLFTEIVRLDRAFAEGEIELDDFLRKRENLVAKVASRRIESVAEGGRVAILDLDRLYSEKAIDLEAYLRRRQLILDIFETLGVDPLIVGPFGSRSSLINSFELDQLLAEERIELSEYISRRRLAVPKKERPPETRKVTAEDIMNLDRLYAEGRIADQAWYLRERAWLLQRLPSEEERKELQAFFEIDQLFSEGAIEVNEFIERRSKLSNNQDGNENGGHAVGNNGVPIVWRGRKRGNGNNRAGLWRLGKKNSNNGNSNHGQNVNGTINGNGRANGKVAAIQGYQWHYLNKSENWLTLGIRAEYSGNYVIERTCEEIFGGMKMIAGSVYMIRADLLRKYGWSTSLTEDWELTCRLYGDGYRVQYTPQIQVPAECPSRVTRLIRQRQRWAEGHTFNAKKYFWKILKSPDLTLREKLEFVYFAPYYLQSVFFMIGTTLWMLSESMHSYLSFWTATFGWSLLLTNLIALPLMSLAGLYAEESAKKDLPGVFSTIVMSYILAPFQAYSALKGLLEKEEGQWIRTFKTGKITEPIIHGKLGRIRKRLRSKRSPSKRSAEQRGESEGRRRLSGGGGAVGTKLGRVWRWGLSRTSRRGTLSVMLLVFLSSALSGTVLAGYSVQSASAQEIVDNTWSLDKVSTGGSLTNNIASGWYRSSTSSGVNYPKNRTWSGTAWGSEVEQATAGSPVRGVRIAYDPTTYGRYVAAMVEDDGTLDAYVCTTSSCTQNANLADLWTTAPTASQRPFDVAFEKASGEALLVYAWFDDATNDLAYRTLAAGATTFGSENLFDDSTYGSEADFSYVVLATRYVGSTDYVGLIALSVTESDALVAVWSGAGWGNMVDLSTSVSIATEECVAMGWETSTGDLVAVSGEGTNIRFNQFTIGSGWGTSATSAVGATANWLKLQPDVDPTDIMMLVSVDGALSADLNTFRWTGSTFEAAVEHDTGVDSGASRVADFAWAPDGTSGQDGILVYGTSSGYIARRPFSAGVWGTIDNTAVYAGTKNWIQGISNPLWESGQMKCLFAVGNSNLDLGAVTWDGTTFAIIGVSTFTADVGTGGFTYEVFAIKYNINPGWYYMRDTSTPTAGTLVLSQSTQSLMSDRTGADRYITSPILGSSTWTLYLSWSSKSSGAFAITFAVRTSQGRTLQTLVVSGTISLPSGSGAGTAQQNVNQVTDVTPAQTPYDIVLQLTLPSGATVTLNTGSGGSYLQYSGTLVPETILALLVLMPVFPLMCSKRGRRKRVACDQ